MIVGVSNFQVIFDERDSTVPLEKLDQAPQEFLNSSRWLRNQKNSCITSIVPQLNYRTHQLWEEALDIIKNVMPKILHSY